MYMFDIQVIVVFVELGLYCLKTLTSTNWNYDNLSLK